MIKTYNFKLNNYDYDVRENCSGEFVDTRNDIICIRPTADLECYRNYIDLLNIHIDKWKNYGYLDLGMMPLAMAPSFMNNIITEFMVDIADLINLPFYRMPAVSVMCSTCKVQSDDIWVFKEDVVAITGIPINKLTLSEFLRWCITNASRIKQGDFR